MKNTVYTLIYASKRIDLKELDGLRKMFKPFLDKDEYKNVLNEGVPPSMDNEVNPVILKCIAYRACSPGEKYYKLYKMA